MRHRVPAVSRSTPGVPEGHTAASAAGPGTKHPPMAVLRRLGPGLVTGAADDDPSGIATYSQVGAQFGYTMGWTVVLSLPLMAAVQEISARLGCVTGQGLAATLRDVAPRPVLAVLVSLLVAANVINLGADLGAMADAVRLLVGGPQGAYAVALAAVCAATEIWLAYRRYVLVLKWMTLFLFAYVALVLSLDLPWREVLEGAALPRLTLDRASLTALVAVLGTTISPYLFFWQASEEVEEQLLTGHLTALRARPLAAAAQLARIRTDTWIGMGISNVVALAIIVGTAATLHAAGVTKVATAADAAAALRPIAGRHASVVFAAGILGTGLLAVPVLAGSAAYAVGEAMHWKVGLSLRATEARAFYGVIAAATLVGSGIVFSPLAPMDALFWSAVLNGIISAPMIVAMLVLASRTDVMGTLTLPAGLKTLGWATAGVMAAVTAAMLLS